MEIFLARRQESRRELRAGKILTFSIDERFWLADELIGEGSGPRWKPGWPLEHGTLWNILATAVVVAWNLDMGPLPRFKIMVL